MNKHCHERPENSGALLLDRRISYILDYIYFHNKRYPQEMGVDELSSLEVVWKVCNSITYTTPLFVRTLRFVASCVVCDRSPSSHHAIAPHTPLN
ncbi:hypothetical protein [Nostoc sp.]|uniref:hypothetical protein n=1 Tax=Nostoc sp. TaxID=1180 RepID=UPI002FFA0630